MLGGRNGAKHVLLWLDPFLSCIGLCAIARMLFSKRDSCCWLFAVGKSSVLVGILLLYAFKLVHSL